MALKEWSNEKLHLLLNYPCMRSIPTKSGWRFFGSIEVMVSNIQNKLLLLQLSNAFQETDYQIRMSGGETTSNSLEIIPSINLKSINLEEFKSPLKLLNTVKAVIEKQTLSTRMINKTNTYRKVLVEYTEFLRFHINIQKATLSDDLSEVKITMLDQRQREHIITVKINFKNVDDKTFFVEEVNLPFVNAGEFYAKDNSLIAIFDKFTADVDCPEMQDFLNYMEEIDKVCWILDPLHPIFQDSFRRINLTSNVSAVVTYNSLDFKSIPTIRFLGPKKEVAVFEDRLNANYINWDNNCDDPLQEFLIVIGIIPCFFTSFNCIIIKFSRF